MNKFSRKSDLEMSEKEVLKHERMEIFYENLINNMSNILKVVEEIKKDFPDLDPSQIYAYYVTRGEAANVYEHTNSIFLLALIPSKEYLKLRNAGKLGVL